MDRATHLCDFLPFSAVKDLSLVFEDGNLQVDKIILLATSDLRQTIADCDEIIIESKLEVGEHLLRLLTTGETNITGTRRKNEIEVLLKALQINIDIFVLTDIVDNECQDFGGILETYETMETVETIETIETDICELEVGDIGDLTNIIIAAAAEAEGHTEDSLSTAKKKTDKVMFQCDLDQCGLMFEGISQFKKHTNEVHNARPLACPEKANGCSFRADDHGKLENHTRGVHKDLYSEHLTCEFCQRVFASKSYLKSHIRRMHKLGQSEREKVCPYCGESKLQLNDHIMRAHKEKRFFCDLCPKSFRTSVQRRIHRNVHTGFRPYTCHSCDKSFARLHHRKIHLERTGHTPGPVLKPDDHVDYRSAKPTQQSVDAQDLFGFVDQNQEILVDSERLKNDFVNCAEIIENITFSNEVLDFD